MPLLHLNWMGMEEDFMTNAHNPNPQEQYDSARTARFHHTRTVQEIAGAPRVALNARYTSGNYPKLYNVSTGGPNELFAYGGGHEWMVSLKIM